MPERFRKDLPPLPSKFVSKEYSPSYKADSNVFEDGLSSSRNIENSRSNKSSTELILEPIYDSTSVVMEHQDMEENGQKNNIK